jgi:hypothetical protein
MDPNQIAVEWHDDQPFNVQIENFNYAGLDSVEDVIRECLAKKEALKPLLQQIFREELQLEHIRTIGSVVGICLAASKPGMAVYQIAFATGMTMGITETGPQIAKRFGVSKQDFQQGVDRFAERLNLRKNRAMRSGEAKEKFSKTHYRKMKEKTA